MPLARTLAQTHIGVEVEVESNKLSVDDIDNILMGNNYWVLDTDEGSLRAGSNGWEVKTRGNNGRSYEEVMATEDTLASMIRGSSGNWRAAVHCHVDIRGLNNRELGAVVAAAYCFDDAIFEKYSPERRESNFCVPLSHDVPRTTNAISRFVIGSRRSRRWCKYTSVNIQAMERFGTVEFRHMRTPSCDDTRRDGRRVAGWIFDFSTTCAKIVAYVRGNRSALRDDGLASFLTNPAYSRYVGLPINEEALYHVLQAIATPTVSAADIEPTTLFQTTMGRVTPSEPRRPAASRRVRVPPISEITLSDVEIEALRRAVGRMERDFALQMSRAEAQQQSAQEPF